MLWLAENKYDPIILSAAARYGVPVSLIKGVIAAESAFKVNAHRDEPKIEDASRGLMQLLRVTAEGLGYRGSDEGLYEPYTNIDLGTKLLSQLYAQTGEWHSTVSAYNGGLRPELGFGARVTRRGIRCMEREVPVGEFCNQKYVDRVMRFERYFATGELPTGDAAVLGLLVAIGLALPFYFGAWDRWLLLLA